ncbi:Hypothetical predicted protein [Mytilus galloprovincialis]|uniref:Uncharacterized protein n=1 Tax=Mytilus galloprovincialis TaxID=29158 RepID=A0A8B6BR58_MYTGA|nr:Hypothetical predicted protein [Mytilus galloprovincialis]
MKIILVIFVVLGVSKSLPDSNGNQKGHGYLQSDIDEEHKMSTDDLKQHMRRNLQNLKDEKQKTMLENDLKNIPDNKLREQIKHMDEIRNTGKTADFEDMSIEEMRQRLLTYLEIFKDQEKKTIAQQKLQSMSDNEIKERMKGMMVAVKERRKRSKGMYVLFIL